MPVPERPEERAALAQQVIAFRRNQLQPAQQESNLPNILGAAALGLGALVGGAALAKRFVGKKPVPTVALTQEGTQNVQNLGMMGRQAANEAAVIKARAERPQ